MVKILQKFYSHYYCTEFINTMVNMITQDGLQAVFIANELDISIADVKIGETL